MDRFTAGWISGVVGGVLMNLWDFFSFFVLQFTQHTYVDWTSAMIYGKLSTTTLEFIVALILNFLFAGFLGSVLAMIIFVLGSDHYLLKGVIISTIFAFIFFTAPTLFQEPIFRTVPVDSVISNYIGAIIWGLTVPAVLHRIDVKKTIKA